MSFQVSKMRLTLKRILQALFLAVLFSFSTLSLWPGRFFRSVVDEEENTLAGSLMNDNEIVEISTALDGALSMTTTTKTKPHTTLDDIFISVKTTKNFHASRLDFIIKTWFTLAREQVYTFVLC